VKTDKLLTLFGLKFHPFRPEIPIEALHTTPAVDAFCGRVEFTVGDGGFVMVTGEPGTGKSVALRLLAQRLRGLRDVVVGTVDHPQSRVSDFYRELGDIFGVPFPSHNRWAGFKTLRSRWGEHIATTLMRPVLVVDEAQDMLASVLAELRSLTSKEFDSRSLLCVVLAGDNRLPERLRSPDLLPLGSRIRRRLSLEPASRDELCACLDHVLDVAGNPGLMTTELKATVAEHAAGNYRVMMNIADELLVAAAERDLARLDEKLYFEVFQTPMLKSKTAPKKREPGTASPPPSPKGGRS
jgi:general secretion pathway protein A